MKTIKYLLVVALGCACPFMAMLLAYAMIKFAIVMSGPQGLENEADAIMILTTFFGVLGMVGGVALSMYLISLIQSRKW